MSTETIIYRLEQVIKLLKEQNMLLKRVFNSRDAALYLGISLDSLYHLTGKNRIPCYKMNGHRLFFSHDELEKWVLSARKTGKERGGEGMRGRGDEGERGRLPKGDGTAWLAGGDDSTRGRGDEKERGGDGTMGRGDDSTRVRLPTREGPAWLAGGDEKTRGG